MASLSLLFLLFSRGLLANQAPLGQSNKCFTSSISGSSSYKACCSGASTGVGRVEAGAGGEPQYFQYTCASYIARDFKQVPGFVSSARACAEVCAADSACQAGSWDSGDSLCFTASTTNLEYADDEYNAFLRFEKMSEGDVLPGNEIECEDQVADARRVCENEQAEECKAQLDGQEQDLQSRCEQRIQDKCNSDAEGETKCKEDKVALEERLRSECQVEQDQVAKEWKQVRESLEGRVKELQKQGEQCGRELDELQKQKESRPDPTPKPSPKPEEDSVYEIPPLAKWKRCSDMEGQTYSVMGVTYQVFCGMHPPPRNQVNKRNDWIGVDPAFMMAMCSTTPGCQGVKVRDNGAQLTSEHEFPPSNRVQRSWWSLVPRSPRADNEGTDIRGKVMDEEGLVKCPEVDGQVITLGEQSYQLNCNRKFNAHKRRHARGVKPFNECLVQCSVTKGCKGVMRDNGCSLVFSHTVLPRETPEEDQSRGDSWVAMLTERQ